jgi:hypothetical protein
MSKSSIVNQQSKVPADQPSYLRDEVTALLGESAGLKKSVYVKRRHIMDCYGISARHFRNIVEAGSLTPKHFAFK